MNRRTFLLATTALVASAGQSHADPVSLGSLIITAALGVGAGGLLPAVGAGVIGSFALGAAVLAANVAASIFLQPQTKTDPQKVKTTEEGSEGPGRYLFGRAIAGGKIGFGNTSGYKIYRMPLHAFGPLDFVEEYYYGGRIVVIDAVTGECSSPPYFRTDAIYLNVKTKTGDGTETAWSDLTTDFAGLWTSDHKVRGIAHSLLRFTSPGTGSGRFGTLLQGGVKDLELLGRWGRFYDQRNGAHDIGDPSTWTWTLNGVLIVQHFLRMLPGFTDALIDFDHNADTADAADALVATATGTTPRCRLSGGWEGPLTYDIVLDMMESAGLAMRRKPDGRWGLSFIEDDPEPELTLTAENIIDISPLQVGPEGVKRPNIVKLNYFSPERRYEMAEIGLHEQDGSGNYLKAGWSRIDDEIERYGEQEFPVQLTFQMDHAIAQRVARRMLHMARAEFATVRTNWAGMAAMDKKIVLIEIPDVGEDGASVFVKCRKGAMRIDDASGTCEIPVQFIPAELATPWNPATMEAPPPPLLAASQGVADLPDPAAPTYALVQYSGGGYEVRLGATAVSGGTSFQGTWRTFRSSLPQAWLDMTEIGLTFAWRTADAADLGNEAEFRVQYFGSGGAASNPSPVARVEDLQVDNSTPGAPNATLTTVSSGLGAYSGSLSYSTSDLNVVKLEVRRGATVLATQANIRPLSTFTYNFTRINNSVTNTNESVSVYAYTSDGTVSAATTRTYTVPGNPP